VAGNPSDGVRDLPDVSLFASNGWYYHYYPLCYSNTADKVDPGSPCTGAPNTWSGAGGTSFSAPIMAGIQALVNQVHGKQGNPNQVYYALAAASYGASGNPACNSNLGNTVDRDCVFRDITSGDMDVPCTGTYNCYKPSGTYGVLSTSDTAYQPAYGTGVGWDFATGIGSVNAAKLVKEWKTVAP
jgi:subtilase family serine protease